MDCDTKIHLGDCNIASYLDENFVLTASNSVTLRLPEQYAALRTAAELRDHIRRGKLWATRAGSCQIELCLNFEKYAGSRDNMQDIVLAAFEACPVWQTLGLQLRREIIKNKIEIEHGIFHTYYMQHISENASLVTPKDIPCVHISTWHCELAFGHSPASTESMPDVSEILSKIITLKLPPKRLRRFAARRKRWDQKLTDNKNRKRRSSPEHQTEARESRPGRAMPTQDAEFYSFPPHLQNDRLEHLTHVALCFVLGLRRKFAGVRVQPSQAISLLEIGPTVFNFMYLGTAVARLQSGPIIASALSNLASTQSPLLRQKVLDLQLRQIPQTPGVPDSLQRSIASLILRSATIAKANTLIRKTRTPTESTREGLGPEERAHMTGPSITPHRDPLLDDDVEIYGHWKRSGSYDQNFVSSNDIGWLDGHPPIFDAEPMKWDPAKDYSSLEDDEIELAAADQENDSDIWDAATEYHDSGLIVASRQPCGGNDDDDHEDMATPCMITGPFAQGSWGKLSGFGTTFELDMHEDTHMHKISASYKPNDVYLFTSQGLAEHSPLHPVAAGNCDDLRLDNGYDYALSNGAMLVDDSYDDYYCYNDELDRGDNCATSGLSSETLIHDGIGRIWEDRGFSEDESNLEDDIYDKMYEANEEDSESSTDIKTKEEPYCSADDYEGIYVPENSLGLDGALRSSNPSWPRELCGSPVDGPTNDFEEWDFTQEGYGLHLV